MPKGLVINFLQFISKWSGGCCGRWAVVKPRLEKEFFLILMTWDSVTTMEWTDCNREMFNYCKVGWIRGGALPILVVVVPTSRVRAPISCFFLRYPQNKGQHYINISQTRLSLHGTLLCTKLSFYCSIHGYLPSVFWYISAISLGNFATISHIFNSRGPLNNLQPVLWHRPETGDNVINLSLYQLIIKGILCCLK